MPFQQITIIGTGLIGGSFGLAVKAAGFKGRIVGSDRRPVLDRALEMGAIDAAVKDPIAAGQGSDLILLAAPVGGIIDLIETLGPGASPHALITDLGGTKKTINDRARPGFGDQAPQRFLAGRPIAGGKNRQV